MKILLTGGGTGGHFYPIIAIAEELNNITKENRLIRPEIYYMSTTDYNDSLLFENNITFLPISAGKIRGMVSPVNMLLNFLDVFKTITGVLKALWRLFIIYPDVVFGKGAYVSFPALLAARILQIPVVIHESDSIPGKVNKWAGKFAQKIAVSYPETMEYFPRDKTAYTGNPIRKEIQEPMKNGAFELLNLDPTVKTILILGGSQGSKFINEVFMDILPALVEKYQIIHQTGKKNIEVIKETSGVVLQNSAHKDRYKVFDYLDLLKLKAATGAAELIISRAGSTIFEIASWGKPSIIIPIPEPTSHDQRTNAYSYARTGAAEVIEEKNLTPHVLKAEIERLLESPVEKEKMAKAAIAFSRRDAARLIADEIMTIALSHQSN